MGLKFRKSIRLPGGFRINLSQKGVGVSAGVKGFRVTKTADGKVYTTTSVPGTGLYARHQISGSDKHGPPKDRPEPVVDSAQRIIDASPYEHISFYLEGTRQINEDGTKRQDILYKYKMRKPPFDQVADFSILSDTDAPEIIDISLNDQIIGRVPAKQAIYINDNWERADCVSAMDIEGRRGEYDAYVHFRFFKPGRKPDPSDDEVQS